MSSSHTVRCDQCGRTEDDKTARAGAWLRILHREPIVTYYKAQRAPEVDVCSWSCARDFAQLRILDPPPEKA